MDLVELQQGGQVLELLIADLKAAVRQGVNDVVGHPGVLGYRQHVIPRAGGRIPHQEHAVPLPLQPSLRLRPRHRTHVPAGAVRRIEPGGGGHGSERERAREGRKKAKSPEAPREEESRGGEGPDGQTAGLGTRRKRPARRTGGKGTGDAEEEAPCRRGGGPRIAGRGRPGAALRAPTCSAARRAGRHPSRLSQAQADCEDGRSEKVARISRYGASAPDE